MPLKLDLTLPLDRGAGAAKALPVLLADRLARPERLIELWLNKYAIAANTAAEPCGERLLVGEAARVHRAKLQREALI